MDIKEFQRLLKKKKFDTEFWMEQMKYGGADPMLELGIRMQPNVQVLPSILKKGVTDAMGMYINPEYAQAVFGKQSASAPEILRSDFKSSVYPEAEDLYNDAKSKGLLAENAMDFNAYPQYPTDKGLIGQWADTLARKHKEYGTPDSANMDDEGVTRLVSNPIWGHEFRHGAFEALEKEFGHKKLGHVTEEILARQYDQMYGTDLQKKEATRYIKRRAKRLNMSVDQLLSLVKRKFAPSEMARDTNARRLNAILKKRYREARE